jgi:hypothetical protein
MVLSTEKEESLIQESSYWISLGLEAVHSGCLIDQLRMDPMDGIEDMTVQDLKDCVDQDSILIQMFSSIILELNSDRATYTLQLVKKVEDEQRLV